METFYTYLQIGSLGGRVVKAVLPEITVAHYQTLQVRAPPCTITKRVCTTAVSAHDKACQLLAQGRLFSPGTQVKLTTVIFSEILLEHGVKRHK